MAIFIPSSQTNPLPTVNKIIQPDFCIRGDRTEKIALNG